MSGALQALGKDRKAGRRLVVGRLIKARKKSKSVGMKDGKWEGMEGWGLGEHSDLR